MAIVRAVNGSAVSPWRSRGLLFPRHLACSPPPWLGGYAALPHAVTIDDRTARVFFSGRDRARRSHVGSVDCDLDRLTVLESTLVEDPLLAPGEPGTFDDAGCSMSCIVVTARGWHLFYTGWSLGFSTPFSFAIGLAVSDDSGRTFRRVSVGPTMGRDRVDPYLCASPSVLVEAGIWRMWYVSGTGWDRVGDAWRPRYLIKYAESVDGEQWRRFDRVAVGFLTPSEYALGRPHVVRMGNGYRMWFCARGDVYRIAVADSSDGLDWKRRDDDQATAPASGDWDAEMQAYPMVLHDHPRRRWVMFYNGNGYGATGFGAATSEDPP